MKRKLLKANIIVLFFLLVCKTTFAQWSNVNPVNAFPRYRETTFVIGDTAYLGNGDPYTTDFRKYTQAGNTWVEIQPYPDGQGGDQGFNFTINDTAYVGDGADGPYHNDFYAYTPSTGWSAALTTPPGGDRWLCSGFSIGDKGYFGTGLYGSTVLSDFYKYDPTSGWTQETSLPVARSGAVAFSVNGKGYMGLGYKDNSTSAVLNDMYQYDPVGNSWTAMASLPATVGMGEAEPAYFVLCGKLIVVSGQITHSTTNATDQVWMFDPSNGPIGTWTRLPGFPGTPAYSPQGFAMGDTGFVYGGDDNGTGISQMWRYVPNLTLALASAADTVVCPGTSVTLNASGGATYAWSTTAASLNDTTGIANYDSTSSFVVTPVSTTTYYYTATGNACFNTSDSVVIKVSSASSLVIEPQSPKLCNGQSDTLVISGGGSNFTWSPSTGLSNTTGDTVIASPSANVTYLVSGFNSTGCAATGTDTISVGNSGVLIITPLSPELCNGQSTPLIISGGGSNFTWSPSTGLSASTGDTVIANPTVNVTYMVSGFNSTGCASFGTDTVIIVPVVPLIITPRDTTICNGSSVTLFAPSSGKNYVWTPTATLSSAAADSIIATPTLQTTYSVTGIDSAGCTATGYDTVYVNKGFNKPVITGTDNLFITTATQGNQWYRDGAAINGATNESYTATDTGCYYDIATNIANGCSSVSNTLCISKLAGIKQLSITGNQLSIYPNPTNGEITLNINSSVGEIKNWYLQITDVLGRTVYTKPSLNYSNDIDLSNLPGGVYFISVLNTTGRVVAPVVKQ